MKKTKTSFPEKARTKEVHGTKSTTSYDTSKSETADPQKVREAIEPEGEQKRAKSK